MVDVCNHKNNESRSLFFIHKYDSVNIQYMGDIIE